MTPMLLAASKNMHKKLNILFTVYIGKVILIVVFK